MVLAVSTRLYMIKDPAGEVLIDGAQNVEGNRKTGFPNCQKKEKQINQSKAASLKLGQNLN